MNDVENIILRACSYEPGNAGLARLTGLVFACRDLALQLLLYFFQDCVHMLGGPARLAGISLERGEISALPGSYERNRRDGPACRARNRVTAHARHVPSCFANCKMADKPKRKNFRWTTEMIDNLINCLLSYKSSMEYRSLDFDADKPAQYKFLRIEMAKLYTDEDESLFGPVNIETLADEDIEELNDEEKAQQKKKQADEKGLIAKGYNRVVEKVKEIRQSFSKAVVAGSRSGSGKIVYEFYDKLIQIWGGSANTAPLSFGTSSEILNNEGDDGLEDRLSESEDDDFDSGNINASGAQKRKPTENAVPRLVDNKRKHLEKNLSAAERDKILINEAREDKEVRKNFTDVMKESNQCFLKAMECMSKSMSDVAAGISRSMEMVAHVASTNRLHPQVPQVPLSQNIFHQGQGMQPNYPVPLQYSGYQPFHTAANTSPHVQNPCDENQFINLN